MTDYTLSMDEFQEHLRKLNQGGWADESIPGKNARSEVDQFLSAFKRDTEIALLERLAGEAKCCDGPGCWAVSDWLEGQANELRKEQD